MIEFAKYRWIVVNSSGGKDSQTALRQIVLEADRQGYPRKQIVVSHQCLGRMEWPGTRELAEKQADHYGLTFVVSAYRNKDGQALTLLDYVRQRGMWPSSANRYCTSEFKRGPGGRVLTAMAKIAPGPILNVYGFRAEESPNRAKKQVLKHNSRFSSGKKEVTDYLPIHTWTEAQVWEDIRISEVAYHYCYDLGMPRHSCVFCIFAPKEALIIAGHHNMSLLQEYVDTEDVTGHKFKADLSLREVLQAVIDGQKPTIGSQQWNM